MPEEQLLGGDPLNAINVNLRPGHSGAARIAATVRAASQESKQRLRTVQDAHPLAHLLLSGKQIVTSNASHPATAPSYPFDALLIREDSYSDAMWTVLQHCEQDRHSSEIAGYWPSRANTPICWYAAEPSIRRLITVEADSVVDWGSYDESLEALITAVRADE